MTVRILSLAALCVSFLGAAAFGQDMAEMYAQGYRLDAELKARSAPIMPSLRWQRNVTFAEALPVKEGKSTTSLALDLLHPADAVAKPRPLVLFVHGGGWASGNRSMGEGFLPLYALPRNLLDTSKNFEVGNAAPAFGCSAAGAAGAACCP